MISAGAGGPAFSAARTGPNSPPSGVVTPRPPPPAPPPPLLPAPPPPPGRPQGQPPRPGRRSCRAAGGGGGAKAAQPPRPRPWGAAPADCGRGRPRRSSSSTARTAPSSAAAVSCRCGPRSGSPHLGTAEVAASGTERACPVGAGGGVGRRPVPAPATGGHRGHPARRGSGQSVCRLLRRRRHPRNPVCQAGLHGDREA